MGRYLRAAFWIRVNVPGLGQLPVNALALLGFAILGLGHPGFWLIGLGLETAWLFTLSNNDRFRAVIDARAVQIEQGTTGEMREALVARLALENRQRLAQLEKKGARALRLQKEAGVPDVLRESNEDTLNKLSWFFLKLLVARENLQALGDASTRLELEKKLTDLERALAGRVSSALRESKEATLKILRQRLAHVDRREESIAEIDSDLTRIEAQFDLAVDNAGLRGQPTEVSAHIHFVSQFLDDAVFGEASGSITALDQTYGAEPPRPVSE